MDHTGTTEPLGCLFPCSCCGTDPCLCPILFCPFCSLSHKNVILPLHCGPSHAAVVCSCLSSGCRGVRGGLPFSCPAISSGEGRWVEVQWGLASVPALQGHVHGALVGDAQELLCSFPCISRGFPGQVAASSHQVCAHALKELLDADLGKAPGVLSTRLIKQLPLDVDVVGPVSALQEGSLAEARPKRSDQKSQSSHQQHKAPAQSLQG